MNAEQKKTGISDVEECITPCSMIKDFYNRKMLSIVILTWFWFLVILALAIFSGTKYFQSEEPKDLIFYTSLFIIAMQFVVLMKIFAWQFIHRNSIKRDIKKLELRITELTDKINR